MGTQVSVAGARPNQISFQVDGADVNTQGNGAPGSAAGGMLGVDTVREFQVLVNNYSAEYGRSTGGIVVAVTRSGTNSYTRIRLRVQPQQHVRLAHLLRRSDQVDSTPQAQSVRRHARRADRPRQGVLLRQLRRSSPDAGADDDRERAEHHDARAQRSQRRDRSLPAHVSGGERPADRRHRAVHPAGRQPDARKPRASARSTSTSRPRTGSP